VAAGGTRLPIPSWAEFKEALRIANWKQLKALGLPNMGLSGPIGPLSYYLPQLTMLDLSGNQLTGVIPPDLSSFKGLMYLNLANNTVYGACLLPRWTCLSDVHVIYSLAS
jgi:hypothetical protein